MRPCLLAFAAALDLQGEFGDLLADLADVQHSFEESRSAGSDLQQVYCIQQLFITSSECNTTHHLT